MATYMLIEINCDHLKDLDEGTGTVGSVLAQACRNPHGAAEHLQDMELYRAVRLIGQTGVLTYADDIKKYWLWKPGVAACTNKPEDKSGARVPPIPTIKHMQDTLDAYVTALCEYFNFDSSEWIEFEEDTKIQLSRAYDIVVKARG